MNTTFLLLIIYTLKIFPTYSWSVDDLKNAKQAGAKIECLRNSALFTKTETFQVPCGVISLRVLAVGGGAAGRNGEYSGGSSGFVAAGEIYVSPLASYVITVGRGGKYSEERGGNSSFGSSIVAQGGSITHGGSGGGGGREFDCTSGDGGSNGSNGAVGNGGFLQGSGNGNGQGSYSSLFAIIKYNRLSAGMGGSGTGVWRGPGGGGGGGVLINNRGPVAGNGASIAGGEGGKGYGAGGGGGGYTTNWNERGAGGAGADGLVYIEWW